MSAARPRLGAVLPSRRLGAVLPSRRLTVQPGEVIERDKPLEFRWNGRPQRAFAGDTIASALAAAGERVLSRSFKYHRPRGVLSGTFHDPNCLVQVDDEPNVRATHHRVRAGIDVRAQNAWPSLRLDAGSLNQLAKRFIGPGFYYKTFMKPERLWPAYERVLQRFAPGGRVRADDPTGCYDKRYAHPDVLVAGGGPAGMAAALAAASAGATVLLAEEEPELGGHLRYGGQAELTLLAELRQRVAGHGGIEVLTDSVVTGRYDDNWIAVLQRSHPAVEERLIKARPHALVLAPGLIERPYVFEGNDLPGVMLATAVRRLVNLYAVRPGERAVVLSANEHGDAAAADLERAGAVVVRLVDARRGGDVVRASGSGGLERVELGDGSSHDCDLLVTATGWTAPTSLLNMCGDRPRYDEGSGRFVPGGELPADVFVTGGIVGDGTTDELIAHGAAIGELAASAGRPSCVAVPLLFPKAHPAMFQARTHGFVDFSEDVLSSDVVSAAREGYDSVELVKRYTTATMGPAQGKLETVNTVAVLAAATGRTIGETGTTVWRPPFAPVSLGALAGRHHEPVRRSPMQQWHERHGATMIVAGEWLRPEHYGDPAGEVRHVRSRVGVIDVTPLGKVELHGPDVPRLLELLYVNKWSRLDVGAVRYGVMCGEDGVVLDDGVTGRLAAERYFMSTTSSNAAAVHEWIEMWLQNAHRDWKVHVTSVLSAYASINVAGPLSRQLLGRLVEGVDLTTEAFPYMRVRTGRVAGVDGCHMWRIGFTGELSFELHVPAGYGLHVWEQLLEAGADLGVQPFGLEAQRIMRLEKGHLIVAQDTDATTRAHAAGLGSLVKLDKQDFAGKPELVFELEEGTSPTLVALHPADTSLVPPEASQIVTPAGAILGRITSSRFSPTLGRSICLAVLDASVATAGTTLAVQLPDGRRISATVMAEHASYDPDGARLRG